MKRNNITNSRILAVYPNSRGFGFAVLEGPTSLVDWGVTYVRTNNPRRCLKKVRAIIERFQPDRLVTEHPHKSPHRGVRIRRLLSGILDLAADMRIPRTGVSRERVRHAFSQSNATTKQAIARVIADHFPELHHRLPPKRKPWMSEDSRMAIFDAVALGLSLSRGNRLRNS
jgi:hypothetical protein